MRLNSLPVNELLRIVKEEQAARRREAIVDRMVEPRAHDVGSRHGRPRPREGVRPEPGTAPNWRPVQRSAGVANGTVGHLPTP